MSRVHDSATGAPDVHAAFGFDMFECDPDEISTALGLAPDAILRKGSVRKPARGGVAVVPFNNWSIKSASIAVDANVHIRQLLERLGDRYRLYRSEWGNPWCEVRYRVAHMHSGGGPYYEPDVLEGLVRWRATLWQDIYVEESD